MTIFRPAHWLALMLGLACIAHARPLYDTTPITSDVQRIVALHALDGASLRLSKKGLVHYREMFGSYTPETRESIASASKWLSALALARLVEKGVMGWNDSVGLYIPDAPVAMRGITLRQLFSHTAGMSPSEHSCISNPFMSLDNCTRQILAQPLIWTPGNVFAYGGNSMQVAGRMAEIAAGKSWDQIFIDELVQPLGLVATDFAAGFNQAGYVRVNNPRIAGGVRSTVIDYGVVVDMVLADGLHNGQPYLARTTLDYMALDHGAGAVIAFTPYPESYGYGLGQWREAVDAAGVAYRVSSPGAFGTTPWVDRRVGVAGVFFVRGVGSEMREDLFGLRALCSEVFDTRRSIKPPTPKPAVVVAPAW